MAFSSHLETISTVGFCGGEPQITQKPDWSLKPASMHYIQQVAEGNLEKCKGLLVPPKDTPPPTSKVEGNPCKENRQKSSGGKKHMLSGNKQCCLPPIIT